MSEVSVEAKDLANVLGQMIYSTGGHDCVLMGVTVTLNTDPLAEKIQACMDNRKEI